MELIDKTSLEGRTLYFIGANNKIYGITEAAIAQILNERLHVNLQKEIYLTKEEAEAKLEELKEGAE